MPLNNNLYGVYKIISVRTDNTALGIGKNPYVIKTFNVADEMDAKAEFYMQGTPMTKIMNIANASQSFNIKAPILVSTEGNTIMDGLQLLFDITALQYTNGIPNNRLPLLTSAKLNISNNESSIDIVLKSDGDPNNSLNVYEVNYGTTAQTYITTTGLNNAARVAKNYDFFIDFGGFKYFVEDATIDIKVKTDDFNFLGVYPENYRIPTDGLNSGVYQGDDSYSGWQFPFIGVGGIEITITGKAGISIDNDTGARVNYEYPDSLITSDVDALRAASNVTLQRTGQLNFTANDFNIYYTGNAALSGVLPPLFAVNRSIVTAKTSAFSDGKMTADFTVKVFVGVD